MFPGGPAPYSIGSILLNLRFNVVPEPPERLAIQGSITDAQERLQQAAAQDEAEVDSERTEPKIKLQHEELSRFIAYSSSRLALIRRLHPEILSLIFEKSTSDHTLAIGLEKGISVNVAAVSFHWRAVALSTPSVWSRFSISPRCSDTSLQIFQFCLERAKISPLTITLRKDEDHNQPVHRGMVDRLIQTSDRWQKISFPLDRRLLPLFAPVRGRLAVLESASFYLYRPKFGGESPDPSLENIDAFEIAPKLHSLSLLSGNGKYSVTLTILETPGLRSLTCHRLAYISDPEERLVVLAFLTTVNFKRECDILRNITAPNLESMVLTDMKQFTESTVFTVSNFLHRSQAPLHTLVLHAVPAHWTLVVQLLGLVPTLQALTIVDGPPNSVTDKAVEALIVDPMMGAEVVLPNLRRLELRGSYLFRTSKLLDMLESRSVSMTGAGAALQSVDLRLELRQFAEGELQRFRALKRAVKRVSLRQMGRRIV
ncbi:hypothetical protein C8R45DRAFT_979484 [Mycena sanguinolenta]|nr:hypothetical protein C8R45DRAFT_979484 [Mycena sanguinolenta]